MHKKNPSNRGAHGVRTSFQNAFKDRFLSRSGAAGIVNGTLKGIPHQFPTPNAA